MRANSGPGLNGLAGTSGNTPDSQAAGRRGLRVTVTGGAGFIGSRTVGALLAAGHAVSVVDDLSTGRRERLPEAVELAVADLTTEAGRAAVWAFEPEVLLHLAANASVVESIGDPRRTSGINLAAALDLLEDARRRGVRFVFASSAAVYGPALPPVGEDAGLNPMSPYGADKAAVEQHLAAYRQCFGLQTLALRYANVYGRGQDASGEGGVVTVFTKRALGGRSLVIHGDGTQTRDFIHVDDIAVLNVAACESTYSGVLNGSTGIETGIAELARLVVEAGAAPVPVESGPPRTGDIARSALDASRAAKVLGWAPALNLADGLREMLTGDAAVS